jgi:hypothetical protein
MQHFLKYSLLNTGVPQNFQKTKNQIFIKFEFHIFDHNLRYYSYKNFILKIQLFTNNLIVLNFI